MPYWKRYRKTLQTKCHITTGELWQFDESSYYKDQNEKEAQAAEEEKKQEEEAELAISQEDLINAITEMAQIISDLQEQVNKLSGVEE